MGALYRRSDCRRRRQCRPDDCREVLGMAIGPSEAKTVWGHYRKELKIWWFDRFPPDQAAHGGY